jgi:hypothetical protein
MLKKSKSCNINLVNINSVNINLYKLYKTYKSYNDLINLSVLDQKSNSNSNLFINKKRKLVSYGEFLRTNIKPSKKQRIQAITDFYNNLY